MIGGAHAGFAAAALALALAGAAQARTLEVNSHERLLVVAPHPDDETLGAWGLIQRVLARGGTVRVVLVTAGDDHVEAVVHETGEPRPRPAEYVAYRERRLREARRALDVLGGRAIGHSWRRSSVERSPSPCSPPLTSIKSTR